MNVWLFLWLHPRGQPCAFLCCPRASLVWLVCNVWKSETSPWPDDSCCFPSPSGPASHSWAVFRLLPECSSESLGLGSTSWIWTGTRRRCSMTWMAPCPSIPWVLPHQGRQLAGPAPRLHQRSGLERHHLQRALRTGGDAGRTPSVSPVAHSRDKH